MIGGDARRHGRRDVEKAVGRLAVNFRLAEQLPNVDVDALGREGRLAIQAADLAGRIVPRQQGIEPMDFVFDRSGHGLQMFGVGTDKLDVEPGRHRPPVPPHVGQAGHGARIDFGSARQVHRFSIDRAAGFASDGRRFQEIPRGLARSVVTGRL